MPRFIRKSIKKAGAAPGTLDGPRDPDAPKSRISIITYNENAFKEMDLENIDAALPMVPPEGVAWIHVTGVQDTGLLSRIGSLFDIHGLTLEDVANQGQRPKFEDFDDYFFMVLKQLSYDPEQKLMSAFQTGLIARDNLLVSFHEREDPCLAPVKQRIRSGRVRIRRSGSGYLAYALIDSIVDHYFITLAQIGEAVESLEHDMLDAVRPDHLARIHELKREMIFLKKQIWPAREAVAGLMKSESPLLQESTDRFVADVYEHIIHILDGIDSLRELLSGMLDFYMSAQANRMNDVMRTLTIIATIFIPLTFLAGIYGMNFKFMPELDWQWGYFGLLGIMTALGGFMLIYFKHKKWF